MKNRGYFGVVVLAGLVSLSAVAVAFFSTSFDKKADDASPVVVASTAVPHSSLADDDEDGDGLPLWKEVLFGTDPNNPDTNGDGVSDGEEAAQKTNPSAEGGGAGDGTYTAPRALPTTDAVARELFATYAEARSDGKFDAGEIEGGIDAVLDRNLVKSSDIPKRYTLHDFSIESDVNVAAYESAVSNAFREALDVREYELNVFARAVSSNSNAELQKLLVTAAIYEHIRDTLLTLDVPEKASAEHLRVVNDLSSVASAVRGLGKWGGDPLDALALVNEFSEKEKRFSAAVSELYTLIPLLKKQSS